MKRKHDSPHKYFASKHKNSGTSVFRCGLEGCPHFVYEALIVGLISICWRCGQQFVITRKTLRNKKFHCEGCTNSPQARKFKLNELSAEDLLDLLPEYNNNPEEIKEESKTNE